MPSFTGILGTSASQPGNIQLGIGPAAAEGGNVVELTVTHGIDLSEVFFGRSNIIHQTVISNIAVTQEETDKSDSNRQTITHPITVTQSILNNHFVYKTVTHNVTVSQTIKQRNTNVRITVTQTLGVSQSEVTSSGAIDKSVDQTVTVSESIHASPIVQVTSDTINVTQQVTGGVGVRFVTVTQTVTVGQTISARTTKETVSQNISVSQVITYSTDKPRITLTDNVFVNQIIAGGNNTRRRTVVDNINVYQNLGFSGFKEETITDDIAVSEIVRCEAEEKAITVIDVININQRFSEFIELTVSDDVFVTSHIAGPVEQTVADSLIISELFYSTKQFIDITVIHNLHVEDQILYNAPRQEYSKIITDVLTVSDKLRFSPHSDKLVDVITVDQIITPVVKRVIERLTQTIIVSQTINARNNNNRQTVVDTITVSQRIRQLDWTIRDWITVTARPHVIKDTKFIDSNLLTDILNYQFVRKRKFKDILVPIETLEKQLLATRHFYDYNPIGLDYREIFDPMFGSILVPSLTVTLMGAIPTVYLSTGVAGQITLPPPEFGDADGNVQTTNIKRTITGGSYAFVKTSNREKFNWSFVISQLKALELRQWLVKSLSEIVYVTDHNGIKWVGRIMSNPFTFDFQARWEGDVERVVINLEFQLVKVS